MNASAVSKGDPLPVVLVPGLICSPRLYEGQIAPLWHFGPVSIADHRRDETMTGIAQRILAAAPPRFALAGLSMGGYIALEIVHQAPQRVARLALLDTTARPDTSEQTRHRRSQIALAESDRFAEIADQQYPLFVHPSRQDDETLRRIVRLMAEETGPEAFIRQQKAIIGRVDMRPTLAAIRCPTLVLVGDTDRLTPPDRSKEIADAIPGARLVIIPDAGHLTTLEQPEATTEALVEWLQA
jgi:pimeloyl-ACP methyl ester carboxylesterase